MVEEGFFCSKHMVFFVVRSLTTLWESRFLSFFPFRRTRGLESLRERPTCISGNGRLAGEGGGGGYHWLFSFFFSESFFGGI